MQSPELVIMDCVVFLSYNQGRLCTIQSHVQPALCALELRGVFMLLFYNKRRFNQANHSGYGVHN